MTPFDTPIYVTRPLLPSLDRFSGRLKAVWDSKWLSNGGLEHQKFESMIRSALKVPYVSLFNNGTIALIVAVQSLRLQGEVITTPFTFPATTHVLSWNGITPVFCDVDPDTMTLDATKIEERITSKTSGILGVHVYGTPCDVDEIQKISERHGLKVIYDGAHAFMTELQGVGIGTYGDICMFSFHPTKLFHSGEGGCLTYNDGNLKKRIDLLKNFGIKNETEVIMPGINGKMNEIQAVLGQLVLEMVDQEREFRRRLRSIYFEELSQCDGIRFQPVIEGLTGSEQYLVIRVDGERFGVTRDELYDYLRQFNVITRKYFFPLTSEYSCYRSLPTARPEGLPVAHRLAREVLCLPFYSELTDADIRKICALIRNSRR